jgi:hypothetical protein
MLRRLQWGSIMATILPDGSCTEVVSPPCPNTTCVLSSLERVELRFSISIRNRMRRVPAGDRPIVVTSWMDCLKQNVRCGHGVVWLLVALFSLWGAAAHGERVFGEDVLVSGEPVGTQWHRSYSAGQRGIAVVENTVHMVWSGAGPQGAGVYLSSSTDGGGSFNYPVRMNDGGIAGYYACLDCESDSNLYVVWLDKRDGDGPAYNIYFSRSTDGGLTFGPDVRVDDAGDDPSCQQDPAVAVDDSGRIYVVWMDERGNGGWGVYFSRSTDGGATFDSSKALPNLDAPGFPQYAASIAAAGDGRVYVAYVDWRHVDNGCCPSVFCVRRSTDAGETFSEPVDVDSCVSVTSTSTAVAGSLDVFASWVVGEDYCYVSRSSDGGVTFSPGVRVNSDPANISVNVSIDVNSSGWVALAWDQYTGDIGFSESRDWGESFIPMVTLAASGGRDYATVAIDESCSAYLAWTDDRHSSKGDIYFSKGILDPAAGVAEVTKGAEIRDDAIGAWPNPFKGELSIACAGSHWAQWFHIYDTRGRLVAKLPASDGYSVWKALDQRGERVPAGIYFIRPGAEPPEKSLKVILLR